MTAAPIYAEVDGITATAVSHRYRFSSDASVWSTRRTTIAFTRKQNFVTDQPQRL